MTDRGCCWTKAADAGRAGSHEGACTGENMYSSCALHGDLSSVRGRWGLQIRKQKSKLLSANSENQGLCPKTGFKDSLVLP